MYSSLLPLLTILLSYQHVANGDFVCVCNYAIEASVLASPDVYSEALGYLYEFDCKAKAVTSSATDDYVPIMFEKVVSFDIVYIVSPFLTHYYTLQYKSQYVCSV